MRLGWIRGTFFATYAYTYIEHLLLVGTPAHPYAQSVCIFVRKLTSTKIEHVLYNNDMKYAQWMGATFKMTGGYSCQL